VADPPGRPAPPPDEGLETALGRRTPAPAPAPAPAVTVVERPSEPARRAAASVNAPDENLTGQRAGRYILLHRLGAGGAGLVYAAYDPQLDRKVAIKLLRPTETGSLSASQGQARLLREGQAMARLKHPNVLPVYDVGMLVHGDEESVFVAMELVEGGTLRQWMKQPHPRRQILEVMMAAGRGLAAAHAAGLVHRDFKPDNVLVDGTGRVFVTDFGIVRASGTREEVAPKGSDVPMDVLSTPLTQFDAVVGTPGYMAPEQYLAQPVDARTDQFSYCITLYEALTGQRPFAGKTFDQHMQASVGGQLTPAEREKELPAWLRRVVLRGLSVKPDDRHASMEVLLAALADDPSIRRRRVAAVLGGLCAVVLAGTGVARLSARQHQVCRGFERQLDGVWDARLRGEVVRAFVATGLPSARTIADTATQKLDEYAGRWAAMRGDACEATRVRGEQPENVLQLRMACLDNRREEVRTLSSMFVSADAALVRKAIDAVSALSSVQRCGDVAALTAPVPPPDDAATRAKVTDLRARMAQSKMLLSGGRFKTGLATVDELVKTARAIGYAPLTSDALELDAHVRWETGDPKGAEPVLYEAYTTAYAGHDDAAAANAAGDLVALLGYWLARHDEAHRWSAIALSAIRRLGGNDELEAEDLKSEAWVYYQEGNGEKAIAVIERARQLGIRAFGADSPRLAMIEGTLGTAYQMQKRYPEAIAANRRAIDLLTKLYGPDNDRIGAVLTNLGNIAAEQQQFAESVEYHRRALAIMEKVIGPDHPTTGITLGNLGDALLAEKKYAEALSNYRRALGITERKFGPTHPDAVYPLLGIGSCELGLGHPTQALQALERASQLIQKTTDPNVVALVSFAHARALWDSGDRSRAVALAKRLQADFVANKDANNANEVSIWLKAHHLP
jgi:tetratricopeptide (TPR) repeat protein